MIPKKFLLPCFLFCALFVACHDDGDDGGEEEMPREKADLYTQRVNEFIYQVMDGYYFWNDQLPDLDRAYETDSKAYFEKLLVEEDLYSTITDDAESMLNSFQGVETTFGYSLTFFWADEARTTIYAVVDYVYSGTPADRAGIERGDLIVAFDDHELTESNLSELIYNASIKVSVRKYGDDSYLSPVDFDLVQESVEENPVYATRLYDIRGTKVGYLCYLSYIQDFNFALDTAFEAFKKAGVSELILDLRYNLGGDENAIRNLCSHIAPVSACQSKEVIIEIRYNDEIREEFEREGVDPNVYFTDTLLDNNLDLNRIFILTSGDTYSASEVTIVGLRPYMDVIQIGERTGGKDTGLQMFQPYVMEGGRVRLDPLIGNWAVLPIVSKYQNKNGESATGGLAPAYEVDSFYLPMLPLGDEEDPLIAKAIELLGGPATAAKSRSWIVPEVISRATSMYDEVKRNVIKR